MSLLDGLKKLFGAKSGGAGRIYILDAAPLHGAARPGDRLSPRDQVQVLQQLSRFVEREKIQAQAVFEGRPLREVAEGENFGPVQVFFVENAAALPDRIVELFRRAGAGRAVVVSAHPEVEKKVAEQGGSLIRPGTFRRAFDTGGGGGRPDGGGGGDSRMNSRRRRRPRGGGRSDGGGRGRPDGGGNGGGDASQPPQPGSAPAQSQPKDPVRDLIDLVE
ncbi:MAG TPA: hypothetical protein P5567_09890 [Kiritimatiellia bacterium]|nr:hypothetical protein [Kiritimatiellia bacterium]HRZ12750.1 hypothetical protein [Kiritimatiellia bacterium]HSA18298.1 hypothetical protein [Kiritimatiellia bacterium]